MLCINPSAQDVTALPWPISEKNSNPAVSLINLSNEDKIPDILPGFCCLRAGTCPTRALRGFGSPSAARPLSRQESGIFLPA